jgi:osmotically inducible protein OsmC
MATTRIATGIWNGSLTEGSGRVTLESSGLGTFDVTWASRKDDPNGRTSPEELIAAAHAACFSMSLSSRCAKAGHPAEALNARAEVDFQPGDGITAVRLTVSGDVPGLDADAFRELAEDAKANCPVSKALAAVPITLIVT